MSAVASTSSLQLTALEPLEDEEFVYFRASMRLPMAPVWGATGSSGGAAGSGGMEGVKEILAGWVMRYLPPLQSVLLTFGPVPILQHSTEAFPLISSPFPLSSGRDPTRLLESPGPDDDSSEDAEEGSQIQFKGIPIIESSGFGLARVEWQGLGWRPRLGQKLVGSPTLSTPSHISLLLHNLFNASIPSSHIPADTWHFDPDFPVPAAIQERQSLKWPVVDTAEVEVAVEPEAEVEEADTEAKEEGDEVEEAEAEVEEAEAEEKMVVDAEEEMYRERGWWRHNITNEPLGGSDGRIEFTIVGLTIANSMISITGSLLSMPFDIPTSASALSSKSNPVVKAAAKRQRSDSVSSDSDEQEEERVSAPPVLETTKQAKKPAAKVAAKSKVKAAPKVKEAKTKKAKPAEKSKGSKK